MPAYDSALRISQITVCSGNGRGNLKGFSFKLSDPNGDSDDDVDIPIMGKTGTDDASECVDLPVAGRVTKIVTSLTDDGKYVNAISFQRSDSPLPDTFGTINQPWKVWEFEEGEPLVAMYGKTNSDLKIKQLGWVTLDEGCQATGGATVPVALNNDEYASF